MQENTIQTIVEQFSVLRLILMLLFAGMTWAFLTALKFFAEVMADKFARYRLFISSAYPVVRLLTWGGALLFIVFVIFNPPLNTLIAISASAGLAIGLGAQDLIKNIIAGVVILIDRPFRVGDMVDVAGHYGEVTAIGLRSTRIQTFDDSTVTLPNALVLGNAVSNSNAGALDEMVVIDVRLPASVDLPQVKEMAYEAAACSPYVYLKKPITVTVADDFQRTFLTHIKIKAYVLDIRLERLLASDVTERFKQELVQRGLLTEQMVLGLLHSH